MAVCTTCGAELPANSSSSVCDACSAAAASATAAGSARKRSSAFSAQLRAFPVTSALIAVNVAVFIGIVVTGLREQGLTWPNFLAVVQNPGGALLVRWGAAFGPVTTGGPWWEWLRLLTNTFVHIGIVHLAVNMWALLNLGALSEYLFGHRTTLVTYLLTGIAGSVTSLAWHPAVVSAGASGAIFGIAGALIVAFRFARLPLSKTVVRSTSSSLLLFAGYTLAYGIVTGRMDNAAHLGGLAAGLVFGLVIVASKRKTAGIDKELHLSGAAIAVLTAGVLAGAVVIGFRQRYVAPFYRGETAMRANNFKAAIPELRRAVAMRPGGIEPRIALGEAYLRTNQPRLAEVELRQAVEFGPRNAAAWRELGLMYLATQRSQEAAYAYGRTVELQPKSAEDQAAYAIALQMARRVPEAIAAYQKALQLKPSFVSARYNLALAYLQDGKTDEAIAALKQYLDQERADPNAWAALAEAYRRKGMTAEAQDATQRAEALQPRR